MIKRDNVKPISEYEIIRQFIKKRQEMLFVPLIERTKELLRKRGIKVN